jgi:hypothetical protein
MHTRTEQSDRRMHEAHVLSIAVALWFMVAGACVVAANAWAMGL